MEQKFQRNLSRQCCLPSSAHWKYRCIEAHWTAAGCLAWWGSAPLAADTDASGFPRVWFLLNVGHGDSEKRNYLAGCMVIKLCVCIAAGTPANVGTSLSHKVSSVSPNRTSHSCRVDRHEPVAYAALARAARLVGLTPQHSEPLQVRHFNAVFPEPANICRRLIQPLVQSPIAQTRPTSQHSR